VPTGTRNGRYDEVADLRRELFALDERKALRSEGELMESRIMTECLPSGYRTSAVRS